MKIEILGPGCSRCRAAEENVKRALAELNLDAEVLHVTDPKEIALRRIFLTPAVVVDEEVRCSGRVPDVAEIKQWLAQPGR